MRKNQIMKQWKLVVQEQIRLYMGQSIQEWTK